MIVNPKELLDAKFRETVRFDIILVGILKRKIFPPPEKNNSPLLLLDSELKFDIVTFKAFSMLKA